MTQKQTDSTGRTNAITLKRLSHQGQERIVQHSCLSSIFRHISHRANHITHKEVCSQFLQEILGLTSPKFPIYYTHWSGKAMLDHAYQLDEQGVREDFIAGYNPNLVVMRKDYSYIKKLPAS